MSLKMRYDHEDDILMIWFSQDKKVDHAEHVGPAILHLTENGEPILMEVLQAQDFITDLVRAAMTVTPAKAAGA